MAGSWKGVMNLNDVVKVSVLPDETFHRKNCFLILTAAKYGPTISNVYLFVIVFSCRDFFLQAKDAEERQDWIKTVSGLLPKRTSTSPDSKVAPLIGNYRLGATVGAGGYAEVRLGHHATTNNKVAIKCIKNDHEDQPYMDRLAREIALLRVLDHQHINKLHDVVTTKDETYMVLEYIEGETLDDFVFGAKEGRLPENVARYLFRKLLLAIEYCHSLRIVHRDLKMENVMITKNGDVKVIDFGLGNSYEGVAGLMKTFCGTLEYAAPEVLSKERSYFGPPTDVWSLGIVLFLMISGSYPFMVEGMTPADAAAHMRRSCGSLVFPDDMSAGAILMVQRTLVVEPAQRASVKELLQQPWLTTTAAIEDALDPPERFFTASSN